MCRRTRVRGFDTRIGGGDAHRVEVGPGGEHTPAVAGSSTLVVTNKGPSPATAVRAAISLPAGFTVVSAGGGTLRGGIVTFSAPALAPGGSVTYAVVARAPAVGRGGRLLAAVAASQTRDPALLNNVTARRLTLA